MRAPDKSFKPILIRYGFLGAIIAFAGPPIYIHTPKFYADMHGIDLGLLGVILAMLRAVDFIQDPALGWLINKYRSRAKILVLVFAGLLGFGMIGLFDASPPLQIPIWLGLTLAMVFTGFSGLQILYYSTGLNMSEWIGLAHSRIATWRETGVLIGVCAACIAPTALAFAVNEAQVYMFYSLIFAAGLVFAVWLSMPVWEFAKPKTVRPLRIFEFVQNRNIRWLMLIGFLNSLPTGITSTLFLFYVHDRLGSEFHAGPMLLLFFLSAAAFAPFWGQIAKRFDIKTVLTFGMALVVPVFVWAGFLQTGDILAFYIICVLSGAALAADMTLLPALLSHELEQSGQPGSVTFGIWGFIVKYAYAMGAGLGLILISFSSYAPFTNNSEAALQTLAWCYGILPCLFKLLAVIAVQISPIQRTII